ncbi:O-antigen translocase [Halopseudomonas laoshanensis]|uniref:O-antigen translocase n=1 Tax=Halopseudomonas laoshanensis TaxID=2268758 RepID=UPI0037351DB3
MSLIAIASALAGGGVITGVVKYLAEYHADPVRRLQFSGNALVYSMIFSCLVALAGWTFLEQISFKIFGGKEYTLYIALFLVAQFATAANNLAYGVFNGLGDNYRYATVVVIGNILAISLAYLFITHYGLTGAVIALTLPIVAPLIPVAYQFLKGNIQFRFSFDLILADFGKLSHFSLMLLVSAACFPVVEILVRTGIINSLGLDASGIWQGLIRLSAAYLSFFSVFLSFYLVPKASATTNKREIARLVFKTMLLLSGLFLAMLVIVLLLKEQIIRLIFSSAFLPLGDHLVLQMTGDFFRIMGWVIGFVVVAKASTKLYICGELFQGLGFAALAYILLDQFGTLEGVVIAYTVACISYFMLSLAGFFYYISRK